jgi:hypothetical protein
MEDHPGLEMRRFFATLEPYGYDAEMCLDSVVGVFINPGQERAEWLKKYQKII